MKSIKLTAPKSSKATGFTLVELMISMSITTTVVLVAIQALNNTQKEFTNDTKNLELSQKTSSILDIIGRDIRQAGEQIEEPKFPVVKVFANPVDSAKGSSLVLYRAVSTPLSFCNTTNVALGSSVSSWSMSSNDVSFNNTHATCRADAVVSPNTYPVVLEDWKKKRISTSDFAAIYNNNGEVFPFKYTGESESAPGSKIYNLSTAAFGLTPFELKPEMPAYLLEKREYLVCGTDLVVRTNSNSEGQCNTSDPSFQTIASNIERMEIQISLRSLDADGNENQPSVVVETLPIPAPTTPKATTFPDLSDVDPTKHLFWKDIHFVNVKIKSKDPQERNLALPIYANSLNSITSSLSAEASFYPRNVMSSRPVPTP
jgi:type II secretory pathway pseudopilin PulG